MTNTELDQLVQVENLFDEFKLNEAIEILDDLIQREGIPIQQKVSYQFLKSKFLAYQGKVKELFKLGRKMNKEIQMKDIPSLDPLIKDIFINKNPVIT
ncbi:MAG: hypothetical protein ACFE9Z_05645 [Promethearchaeota archaeon]